MANYLHKNASGTGNRNKDSNFFYENCDISNGTFYSNATTDTFTFTNCRLDVKFSGSFELIMGDGTYSVVDPSTFKGYMENEALEAVAVSESFVKRGGFAISIDPVTLFPVAAIVTESAGTYTSYFYNPLYGPTNVIFKDFDGNVISEFTAKKNNLVTAPSVSMGDGWRALTNAVWLDAEGNVASLMLGDADEYVFTAALPTDGSAQFKSEVTVVKLGMSYCADFAYNVYVPKTDGVDIISIAGAAPSYTVFMDGNEYYMYTVYVSPFKALEDVTVSVAFAIDGVDYSADFTFSAYVYAMSVVTDPTTTGAEKELCGSLIRYIEQAYRYASSGSPLFADVLAKLDSFYAEYEPMDYADSYPANEIVYVDKNAIDGVVDGLSFRIYNGARVSLAVTLSDDAVALGYSVIFGEEDVESVVDSKLFVSNAKAVYATLGTVYSVTVLDANGTAVAVFEYSLASYISDMEAEGYDVTLAKAFYAFGKAALDVRNIKF